MRKLRCYAHGKPGAWEAICIDLDVAASGPSLPAVMAALEEAISLYIECAEDEAAADRQRLLGRRAPWHVRLRHWARYQWSLLWNGSDHELYAGFQIQHPA